MSKKTIVPGAMAAYLLYKAYKSGTLKGIKDGLTDSFGKMDDSTFNPEEDETVVQPEMASPLYAESTDSPVHQEWNTPVYSSWTEQPIEATPADTIHGQHAENIEMDKSVYQFYPDTCAIKSQQLILSQFGIDKTQEELIEVAKEHGWYAEGFGTPLCMVGKLLEYYGVEVHASDGNNIFNLANEIAQGHQVIVSVDAYELLDPNDPEGNDALNGQTPNHALVVVGVDTSDPDDVKVIVTDPGTGNRAMEYPADQFVNAWKDSDCYMVTTDEVPTEAPLYPYTPIDDFAGLPLDSLHDLSDMNFDMSQHEDYSMFVDDVFMHPNDLDSLFTQYHDLFSCDDDI